MSASASTCAPEFSDLRFSDYEIGEVAIQEGVRSASVGVRYTAYRLSLPVERTVALTEEWTRDEATGTYRVDMERMRAAVDGLAPGLYLLLRDASAEMTVKAAIGRELDWLPVQDAPSHLALYQLLATDAREAAQTLSCHQEIAADGAFSLAMLGEFEDTLAEGPWGYRRLMTEAGVLGQTLYLGAEACGLQGTGIGCFFDDGLHELFGLQDSRYQVLYQFTVGKGTADSRISNQRPYPALRRAQAT